MLVEVGRDAVESPRAVEDAGAQPEGVRARPDDRAIALDPFAVEIGESLRPGGHRSRTCGSCGNGEPDNRRFVRLQSSGTIPEASD